MWCIMRITYDKNAKAVYIYLIENREAGGETTQISENIYVDYGLDPLITEPIGIEILNVKEIPTVEEI